MKSEPSLPLDHPSLRKSPRLYFAITNQCNRACPWCSVYSSPEKSTFLELEKYRALLPNDQSFEVQLEGGEPTIHPQFWNFVEAARAHSNCTLLVLCTNAVRFPRENEELIKFLNKLGSPLLLKISVNHYLLDRDPGLLVLLEKIKAWTLSKSNCKLIINVRRRKGADQDDNWILEKLKASHLLELANDFFLQRYGLASDQIDWELPFVVSDQFKMINPDGEIHHGDLITRSEAMGNLK